MLINFKKYIQLILIANQRYSLKIASIALNIYIENLFHTVNYKLIIWVKTFVASSKRKHIVLVSYNIHNEILMYTLHNLCFLI